ncbi:MAG TPA: MarR family transcriptional regulator [Candidatus Limnocylindrales bacterium]|nr:MarR family transcriptional regulator [Candidatus Limnocylindrales bacterium]
MEGADPDLVDVLERLVYGAVGLTTVTIEEAGSAVDLTFAQWRVLVVLGERRSGIRVGVVAARIGAAVPSTSRLLSRMERRGLVRSERDAADRRATLVRLTPAGDRVRRRIVERRRARIAELVADIPAPHDLAPALRGIATAFDAYA